MLFYKIDENRSAGGDGVWVAKTVYRDASLGAMKGI
jgi:hypothetical protein